MTQQLYVIGHPVAHSKSPVMYNALYEKLGLDWHYGIQDFTDETQADAFIAQADYLSINITMPYKPNALAACAIKSASAQLTGGVNMIVNKNDTLVGTNTDGIGCIRHIQRAGHSFEDAYVVVCGTGPTSLAMVQAAAMAGARQVVLVGRNKQRSERVMRRFFNTYRHLARTAIDLPVETGRSFVESFEMTDFKFGSYNSSTQAIEQADIIIDATPLGMNPSDGAPFDTSLLQAGQVVYDVVYAQGQTALLTAAVAAGCHTMNGQGMLVGQAVENALFLLGAQQIDNVPSWDDLFTLMAKAAAFDC